MVFQMMGYSKWCSQLAMNCQHLIETSHQLTNQPRQPCHSLKMTSLDLPTKFSSVSWNIPKDFYILRFSSSATKVRPSLLMAVEFSASVHIWSTKVGRFSNLKPPETNNDSLMLKDWLRGIHRRSWIGLNHRGNIYILPMCATWLFLKKSKLCH